MGKPRSRQPAHARLVRRSLVELTAAAVSSAARDGVRVTLPVPIATFFESSLRSEPTRSTGGRWTLLRPGDQQRSGCRRTASSSLQATAIGWTA